MGIQCGRAAPHVPVALGLLSAVPLPPSPACRPYEPRDFTSLTWVVVQWDICRSYVLPSGTCGWGRGVNPHGRVLPSTCPVLRPSRAGGTTHSTVSDLYLSASSIAGCVVETIVVFPI